MNILEQPVSIFANYNTPSNPRTVTIRQFLTSTKYRSVVEQIRTIENKAERDKLKATLPAITPSGTFTYRNADCLTQHSGLICLDIDYTENKAIGNFFDLKEQLVKIPNVAFCIKSVSGAGYAVGVPIAYPERHGQHFDALRRIFAGIGITLDRKCRDVVRLRGYSYDDELYLNDNARVVTVYDESKPQKAPISTGTHLDSNERFEQLISEICRTQIDLTSDYGTWFVIGCALGNELGENGRYYYHQLSQFHPKYRQVETDKQYTACLRKSGKTSSLGLVFSIAEQHGIVVDRPTQPNQLSIHPSGWVGSVTGSSTVELQPAKDYPSQWDKPIVSTDVTPQFLEHTPQSLGLTKATTPPLNEAELITLWSSEHPALPTLIETLELTI